MLVCSYRDNYSTVAGEYLYILQVFSSLANNHIVQVTFFRTIGIHAFCIVQKLIIVNIPGARSVTDNTSKYCFTSKSVSGFKNTHKQYQR